MMMMKTMIWMCLKHDLNFVVLRIVAIVRADRKKDQEIFGATKKKIKTTKKTSSAAHLYAKPIA